MVIIVWKTSTFRKYPHKYFEICDSLSVEIKVKQGSNIITHVLFTSLVQAGRKNFSRWLGAKGTWLAKHWGACEVIWLAQKQIHQFLQAFINMCFTKVLSVFGTCVCWEVEGVGSRKKQIKIEMGEYRERRWRGMESQRTCMCELAQLSSYFGG